MQDGKVSQFVTTWWKWLYPGMGVKRWIGLGLFGVVLTSAGIALLAGVELLSILESLVIRSIIRFTGSFPLGLFDIAALVIIVLGLVCIVIGFRQSIRSVIEALAPHAVPKLADIVYAQRSRRKGPKVVVIGGGTGLSTLLRGLKQYTEHITAIVAVSDDGGSSGRLRTELGVPPPGDLRSTLLALADTEPLMQRLFDHRFEGEGELAGHSFGNLLIAALTEITGDFETAVRESSRVLAIHGRVLPSTVENVSIRAEFTDGTTLRGESKIAAQRKKIRRVYLEPDDVAPTKEVCRAIRFADIVVLGPGSLYTSILPNLLVRDIAQALRESDACKVYVCNVMTQPGETEGYTVSDHVQAIIDHVGPGVFQYVLMNNAPVPEHIRRRYAKEGATWIQPEECSLRAKGFIPISRSLVHHDNVVRHHPDQLAKAIMEVLTFGDGGH